MERLRYSYCGDFGIKSFCQSNPMVDGFVRQLGSVGRDQDMLVHLAPSSNFLNVRSRTTADHRSMRRCSRPPPARWLRPSRSQLSLAPSRIHARMAFLSQIDSFFLPWGMRTSGEARQSRSHIKLLLSGSRGTTIAPNLEPFINPLIGREVEPAFFVARAAGLVTAHTSAFEDRQYVLGEALRFRRAQLSRGRGHLRNHQASSAKRDRGSRAFGRTLMTAETITSAAFMSHTFSGDIGGTLALRRGRRTASQGAEHLGRQGVFTRVAPIAPTLSSSIGRCPRQIRRTIFPALTQRATPAQVTKQSGIRQS